MSLPQEPDAVSPSGGSEIRHLPAFDRGSVAHARAAPGKPADAATLVGVGELFYVLDGDGELWRGTGDLGDVVPLFAGRSVSIPAGIAFQYRALTTPLEFLVATMPRWQRANWTGCEAHYWNADGDVDSSRALRPGPWLTADLREDYDYLAPDGSEIRLLPTYDAGGLAHCTLPAGYVSGPVRHTTVVEVWYVLSGEGEIWRSDGTDEEVVQVAASVSVTIPTGTSFQFRAFDNVPLEILIATFPKWPGPHEAEEVSGRWPSPASPDA